MTACDATRINPQHEIPSTQLLGPGFHAALHLPAGAFGPLVIMHDFHCGCSLVY